MIKLLTILLLISSTSGATDYYVDFTGGNDGNAGTSTGAAWKTINKANTFSYPVGTHTIYLKRGEVWNEAFIPNRNDIGIDAYSTGNLPTISGLKTLTGWTNAGGGIWYADAAEAVGQLQIVTIDGELQRIGRTPNVDSANGGYRTYESTAATPSITDNQLSGTPNWTGAQVVIRKWDWVIDTGRITSHSGNTIIYDNPSPHLGNVNYGYFIQDDIRTLDQYGEWFIDKATKRLSIYFGAVNPNTKVIQYSNLNYPVMLGGGGTGYTARSGITIQNVKIEGANQVAIWSQDGSNITLKNCELNNNKRTSFFWFISNLLVENNLVTNSLSDGISALNMNTGTTTILNNTVSKIGLFAGMGRSSDDMDNAISVGSDYGATVQGNRVDSVAFNGIKFNGNDILIKNNWVTKFGMIKGDCGGIYSYADVTKTNRLVDGNIVTDGINTGYGVPAHAADEGSCHGLYWDGASKYIKAINNTIVNIPGGGVFANEISNCRFSGNVIYNAASGFKLQRFPGAPLMRNDTITHNIVYGTINNIFYWNGSLNDPVTVDIQTDFRAIFNHLDSNYYRTDATKPFHYWYHATAGGTFIDGVPMDLTTFKAFSAKEAISVNLSTEAHTFQSNTTAAPALYSFSGYSKKDALGNVRNNSTYIPAFSSMLFYANGTISVGQTHKIFGYKIIP